MAIVQAPTLTTLRQAAHHQASLNLSNLSNKACRTLPSWPGHYTKDTPHDDNPQQALVGTHIHFKLQTHYLGSVSAPLLPLLPSLGGRSNHLGS